MKINQNGERCSNNIDHSKKERVQRGVIIRTNWNKWRLICISLRSRCAFTASSFHLPRFYRYYDVMAFRYCHSFPLRERIHEDERRQARLLRLLILPNSFSLRRKLNWTRTWAFFFTLRDEVSLLRVSYSSLSFLAPSSTAVTSFICVEKIKVWLASIIWHQFEIFN